jgi:DNA-binding response OmpR family regulator
VQAAAARPGGRVAIIEDDAASAAALKSILTRKGCDVVVASTLADARPLLLRLDPMPRIIVLDLMLPDGSGTELLAELAEKQQASRVVVTTALNDPAELARVQSLRPLRLLRKPIDLVDLLGAIEMM